MGFEFTCPFCDRPTIVTDGFKQEDVWFQLSNAHGYRLLRVFFIVCPNPKCREFTLTVALMELTKYGPSYQAGNRLQVWQLVPSSAAKVFPDYVPKAILDDYREACLIRDLSPKASATLSRRCLQGMIRDFWKVRKRRLIDEINAIKDRVDPLTWSAIDAVRGVGNIGAHMEKDINVILDVDPDEAAKLIGLIELLVRDWYVLRHERELRLQEIVEIGAAKKQAKKLKTGTAELADNPEQSNDRLGAAKVAEPSG